MNSSSLYVPPTIQLENVSFEVADEHTVVASFDREEHCEVIRVSSQLDVRDIVIEEESIEDIVRRIYTGGASSELARPRAGVERRMTAAVLRPLRHYLEFARIGFVNILAFRLRYYTGIVTYLINVTVYYFIGRRLRRPIRTSPKVSTLRR
ncbi:MAG: hypothetical protein R2748_21800 [Bryobacterales bacterium]